MIWPLPIEKIKKLSEEYSNIIVLEELLPFIEEELKINGVLAKGKEYFSFTGELTIEDLRRGLKKAGVLIKYIRTKACQKEEIITRTPMLCSGCPHRPIFHILKANNATVIGDIGCYSLGIMSLLKCIRQILVWGHHLEWHLELLLFNQRLINKNQS